ncbi:FAD-binding oxidoreductase [Myceligenerans halotolerans]
MSRPRAGRGVSAFSRRAFVTGLAATGAAGGAALLGGPSPASAVTAAGRPGAPTTVLPSDRQYADLVRGANLRFTGNPDHVRLVTSPWQVARALQEALDTGKRVAVRSGGHCYEDFVAAPDIAVVIDLAGMNRVYHDRSTGAFAVEAGATLEHVYNTLFRGWGVTIPGGSCPSVGAGGHIAGGGYGVLSRGLGLTVDHLHAVEVVVAGADGVARTVVATRGGEHHDLWWAHTGGGGGNFGIVTRYWFRTPGASGEPGSLLPAGPRETLVTDLLWQWGDLTDAGFARLMRNYGDWLTRHSSPGDPANALFCQLKPQHRVAGSFGMTVEVDASQGDPDGLLDDFLAEMAAGVGARPITLERRRLPWLHAVEWPGFTGGRNPNWRFKIKSAYLRQGFTDEQIAAIHHHLTRTDYQHPGALLLLTSYGGRINAVAPHETAAPQRDSVLKPQFLVSWTEPGADEMHLNWVRELYRDVFSATGGVPVPGPQTDGCYINYADADLADPAWNTSGVEWTELYYKDGYRRLQHVKRRWDPHDVFRHAQSVRL